MESGILPPQQRRMHAAGALGKGLLAFICVAAVARLIRAGFVDSMDFVVYWRAAQAWVAGEVSPYAFSAADRGFVFKYPPFLLPLFLPFGLLGFDASKILWALVELCCLGYALSWLMAAGVARRTAILVTFLFWWIWLAHFFAGQFTMVLMACALWAVGPDGARGGFRLALLSLVFTAKVFSLASLAGLLKDLFRRRVIAAGFGVLAGLHAVVFLVNARTRGLGNGWAELVGFYPGWVKTALSGGQELGHLVIRGQMNHGFTAGVLRWAGVDVTRSSADVIVAVVLFAVLGGAWHLLTRRPGLLRAGERWAGWLGVGLVTHPLAWHHSYVLAFPLCALSLDRAIRSGSRGLIAISLLGIACIGILLPNVIGLTLATPLELVSVKSWGVVLAAGSLIASARRKPQAAAAAALS